MLFFISFYPFWLSLSLFDTQQEEEEEKDLLVYIYIDNSGRQLGQICYHSTCHGRHHQPKCSLVVMVCAIDRSFFTNQSCGTRRRRHTHFTCAPRSCIISWDRVYVRTYECTTGRANGNGCIDLLISLLLLLHCLHSVCSGNCHFFNIFS